MPNESHPDRLSVKKQHHKGKQPQCAAQPAGAKDRIDMSAIINPTPLYYYWQGHMATYPRGTGD